jgi:hypothetical protein
MQLRGLSGAAPANGSPGRGLDGVNAALSEALGHGCGVRMASLRRFKPDLFNVRRDFDKECYLFEMWYVALPGCFNLQHGKSVPIFCLAAKNKTAA